MKLLRLEIEGFRSLRSQTWCPGDLNVLIGPNASGKSNLLRVFELLSISARGGLGRHIQQEGGMEPIVWDGRAGQVHVRALTSPLPPFDSETDVFEYDVTLGRLGNSSAYRIENETLGKTSTVEGDSPVHVEFLERNPLQASIWSGAIPAPVRTVSPSEIAETETLLSISTGPFVSNSWVKSFRNELAAWTIHHGLRTDRDAAIRAPQVTRADTQVDPDGQNLVCVLHTLYASDRDFKAEVNMAMKSAFGDDFDELVFPPAADQRIQMRIRWHSLQREQSAADLSDGTLRFLFLLAVLAHPSPPPLIAIDEPETGLHPSMLPIVAEFARDAATRTQVVLTTHSPEFLDAFGSEPPTTTVVERQDGQTVLRVVADDELEYWLRQYSLGELYRSKLQPSIASEKCPRLRAMLDELLKLAQEAAGR